MATPKAGSDETTIPIKKATRERLYGIGRKGQTWDQLLNELIDEREGKSPSKKKSKKKK